MQLKSASNRQCTLLRKLNRKKNRWKDRLFLLEGARAVQQLLKSDSITVKALFFDEDQRYWLEGHWSKAIQQADSFILQSDIFAEVSDTETPQGVLALCHMPAEIAVEKLASKRGMVVAFDGIQDPGNLGTIIRTATWFEATGLVSGKGTVDLFHPKVVRGTAGATGLIPFMNGDLEEVLPVFECAGWQVVLLDAGAGAVSLPDVKSAEKTVIVVGNEANGISAQLFASGRLKVRIPSPQDKPKVESLNAGVAASIALYDIVGKQSPAG
ncbi:MAG: RNA methyltransferase [Balneolaceae bacterium]|jgi:TrmH family RNA methyltransferase